MSTSNSVYEIRNGEGIIPVGTKKVVADAFSHRTDLFSVKIPEGVTSIGSYAFLHCTSLTDLSLPSTLEFLDNGAEYCVLFTDDSNPISNHVYEKIGYERKVDTCDIDFI